MRVPGTSPELWLLPEVAVLLRRNVKACQNKLARGTFPIRHIAKHPYRFSDADVFAFVTDGRVTNPRLLNASPRSRQYFASARRVA